MQPAGDPTLPPNLPQPPEGTPVPETAKPRRDSRSQRPERELLKREVRSDAIKHPAPQIPRVSEQVDQAVLLRRLSHSPETTTPPAPALEPSAFTRFLSLGAKTPDTSKAVETLKALVAQRDGLKLSQKTELKLASEQFNHKAKELLRLALQQIKDGHQDAFSLLGLVLTNDVYEENDTFLFEKITKDRHVEEILVRHLVQFLQEAIQKTSDRTLFRSDSGWQQKLLRVMHNGYLSEVFKDLDKEIKTIRKSTLVEKVAGEDVVHVGLAGQKTLDCLNLVKLSLKKLPPNLLRLYKCVYNGVLTRFGDEALAGLHLMQFMFLRAINARITKVVPPDRYEVVRQELIDGEMHKDSQCRAVSRTLQAMIGNIVSQGDEKPERIMTCKDPITNKTLLEFIREKENTALILSLLTDLKKLIREDLE